MTGCFAVLTPVCSEQPAKIKVLRSKAALRMVFKVPLLIALENNSREFSARAMDKVRPARKGKARNQLAAVADSCEEKGRQSF